MSAVKVNYSAIYVVLATIFMLVVQAIAPSAILVMIMAFLIPIAITIWLCKFFEVNEYSGEWSDSDMEMY